MDVHWILEDKFCKENKQNFKDYCKIYTIVNCMDFLKNPDMKIGNFSKNGMDCVICYGSIYFIQMLQYKYKNWHPGDYAYFPNYDCAKYYPYFLDYLLNDKFTILPLGVIMKRFDEIFDWIKEDYSLFMRPTRGFKTFTGKVFDRKDGFEKLKMEKDFHFIGDHELILVAPAKELGNEWRVVVADSKVIGGSLYKKDGEIKEECGLPDHVKQYAEEILTNVKYRPDKAFVMDICEVPHKGLKLIEINSFSCSGMYACDLEPIVEEIEDLAYWDWDDFYGGKN